MTIYSFGAMPRAGLAFLTLGIGLDPSGPKKLHWRHSRLQWAASERSMFHRVIARNKGRRQPNLHFGSATAYRLVLLPPRLQQTSLRADEFDSAKPHSLSA